MNNNKVKNIVVVIIVFFLGAIAMYGVIRRFPIVLTTTTTKLEKDVTSVLEKVAAEIAK